MRDLLAEEYRLLAKGLLSRELVVALAIAALAIVLGYQRWPEHAVEIGGKMDGPFLARFHAPESNESLDYRWSNGESVIRLPGTGNPGPVQLDLVLNGWRPEGIPPPHVWITANGRELGNFTAEGSLRTYSFQVDAETLGLGDLETVITTDTFTPAGDPRELGVLVDSVHLSPLGGAGRPVTLPAVPHLLYLTLAVGIGFLWLNQLNIPRSAALAAVAVAAVILAVLVAHHRLGITVFAGQLPALAALTYVLSLLTKVLAGVPGRRGLSSENKWELSAVAGVFALAFAVRFGGMLYPQFLSSDLTMHAHRLEWVMSGNVVFSNLLPDGREAPYPPAYYVVLAPLAYLWSDHETLLKVSSSLFDASGVLILFYILRAFRLGGPAAAMAGFIYAFTPYTFMVFSWGNHTHIFGQWGALLLMAALLALVRGPASPLLSVILPGMAASLTFTSHYGSLLVSLFAVAAFLGLCLLFMNRAGKIRALYAAISIAVALATVSLLYYRHFASLIVDQAAGLGGGGVGQQVSSALRPIARLVRSDLGFMGALSPGLLVGGLLTAAAPRERVLALGIGAWLLAASFFAVLSRVVVMESRHELFATPALALAGGILLARLGSRAWAGRVFAVLVLLFIAWQALATWFERIMYAYH